MRTAAALLTLLAAAPVWGRPRPEPCPVGRFLTADGAHVVADVTAPLNETIVLEVTPPASVRAYLMVDAYPAAVQMLSVP